MPLCQRAGTESPMTPRERGNVVGLDGATSHAVWAIVVVSVLGGLAVTGFRHMDDLAEARDGAESLRQGRVLTRFGNSTFCYYEPAQQVRFTTLNLGATTLDLAAMRLVVDGVPFPVTSRSAGDVWGPGETRVVLASSAVEPTRAALVTPGGDLVFASKVTCPILTTIVVTPASATLDVGESQDFLATGYDQFGLPYDGAPYAWSSAAGTTTVLSPTTVRLTAGTVAGTFSLTASSQDVQGSVPITIKPGAPASLAVSPGVAGVPAGGTQAFTATVRDPWGNVNASSPVSWSTNAGAVDASGLLAAQTLAQAGRSVTATTTGGVAGSATVDVWPAAPASLDLQPGDVDVTAGDEQAFTATMLDAHGNLNDTAVVTWETTAGTITQAGVLTAQTTAANGLGVTATSGAATDSSTVDVLPGAPATVTVSPGVAGVAAGGTQAFAAVARDQYGNVNASSPIAWSTDAGTVTQAGVLTAQTTAQLGRSVTATTTGGVAGTATVDVHAAAPAALAVSPSVAGVTAGGTQAFTATRTDAYGNVNATAPVTWTTTAGSITTGGVLTAQTTAASGLSVTATTTGGVAGTATVDVWPAAPATATVSPSITGVPAGGSRAFTATLRDAYGNVNGTATVTWTTTAGSITSGGTLTAQTTAQLGRSVTATSGAASGSATVDVYAAAPATVSVSPHPTTVVAGAQKTFTATVHDGYGNVNGTASVAWSTNAGTITSGGVLTAQTTAATGRTVSATSGGVTQSATVDVVPGPVDTVTVSPATVTVYFNGTQQFTATLRDQYGNLNTSEAVTWSATSGSVTSGGRYTAPATGGSATVTATANGMQGTAAVTVAREVHSDAVATYKAGVPSTTFRKGTDTVEVRVTVRDHENALVAGASVTVEYVDSNGAVAATRTATTSAGGVASVTYVLPPSAPQNAWVARVTTMSGTHLAYNPAANVVGQAGFTVTP